MGAQQSYLEVSCPGCYCLFRDPVTLPCKHSLCQECLPLRGEGGEDAVACPVCGGRSSGNPKNNSFLQRSVEAYLLKNNVQPHPPVDPLCALHRERRQLYCRQDSEPICVVCMSARRHRDHTVCPSSEKVEELKEELQAAMEELKVKLKTLGQTRDEENKMAELIKSQAQHTEEHIKAEFQKLHQFLQEEEEARLAALRVEEELKSQVMKERIENLTKEMMSLAILVRELQQEMETDDFSFIKNFHNTKSRAQCTLQDPELLSGALIDVAKHLDNLRFRVWEKMLGMVQYTPVTLDPNTAAPWLSLSDDLTSVRCSETLQQLPGNPERSDFSLCVLGSEGFTSGKHSWEVEVGNKPTWTIGVVKKSINRKGVITHRPERGLWVVSLQKSTYQACTFPGTPLNLKRKPQRIRVQLDYDRGKVSFCDPSDMSHIYTFKDTFTERLFPYFSLGDLYNDGSDYRALQLCREEVSITLTEGEG
ncbi:E3 ubiquitin-protein ligase TRIM39-like [Megalops cyprinoides]|uniref:E3 ubiquitin-protein ligase TRIM39-like n=1 Tax=Megalops cyprinoides TaxID=118141 RepID=UPI001864E8B3|nr:E3 ubiquitin-protein ligase TRIM39-like [Megalops cyprinoides]